MSDDLADTIRDDPAVLTTVYNDPALVERLTAANSAALMLLLEAIDLAKKRLVRREYFAAYLLLDACETYKELLANEQVEIFSEAVARVDTQREAAEMAEHSALD